MSDTEPAPTFLLYAFAFIWLGVVIAGGILFGILAGLPKLILAVVLLIAGSPGFIAYSAARRRRQKYYQRLIDEAFSDVRQGPQINS